MGSRRIGRELDSTTDQDIRLETTSNFRVQVAGTVLLDSHCSSPGGNLQSSTPQGVYVDRQVDSASTFCAINGGWKIKAKIPVVKHVSSPLLFRYALCCEEVSRFGVLFRHELTANREEEISRSPWHPKPGFLVQVATAGLVHRGLDVRDLSLENANYSTNPRTSFRCVRLTGKGAKAGGLFC